MLKAAEKHLVILVDGFIMTACALAAVKLYPASISSGASLVQHAPADGRDR